MQIAEAADDTALLRAAYRAHEASVVPGRVEDHDTFIRVNHALVVGLEQTEAAALLHRAFAADAAAGLGRGGFHRAVATRRPRRGRRGACHPARAPAEPIKP